MKEYSRAYPLFSLCGLNCGLCPRYQSKGASRCPGCGGQDFHLKHPSCAVITCSKKHDNVEYCFQCPSYPCDRYKNPSDTDSFISYQKVLIDFEKARTDGLENYQNELNEKVRILKFMLDNYNDGKKMSFYCTAVNLFSLDDLIEINKEIENRIIGMNITQKEKLAIITSALEEKASSNDIELKLRK